jgi:hypothetical protein
MDRAVISGVRDAKASYSYDVGVFPGYSYNSGGEQDLSDSDVNFGYGNGVLFPATYLLRSCADPYVAPVSSPSPSNSPSGGDSTGTYTSISFNSTASSTVQKKKSSFISLVAGGASGGAALVAVIAGLAAFFMTRRRRQSKAYANPAPAPGAAPATVLPPPQPGAHPSVIYLQMPAAGSPVVTGSALPENVVLYNNPAAAASAPAPPSAYAGAPLPDYTVNVNY